MEIINALMTKNPCYTAGKKIEVKGLMLHSIGTPQPDAMKIINYWNSPTYNSACVHAFIDANNGKVYQTLPWNHRGWHCASGAKGSGNNTHIGVEMCEPATIKYTSGANFTIKDADVPAAKAAVQRTYNSAVELFAKLCKDYGLDPLKDGVIISHKEGYSRGIASNHGDPEHIWNQLNMGYTMNGFRADVKKAMSGGTISSTTASAAPSTSDTVPFTVKVPIKNLNIRTGPGTNYPVAKNPQYTNEGVFTIVDVASGTGSKAGWGLLKSYSSQRNGWISLDYCEKL